MTLKHNLSQLGLATEMCIMTGLQSLQNELSLNESGEPKLKKYRNYPTGHADEV